MTRFQRIAPVLPVADVAAALERDGVQMHVIRVDGLDPASSTVSVYLYVDDADALLAEWRATGVDGQFGGSHDTDYGLREGTYVDPDGNLLRFGSPLPPT